MTLMEVVGCHSHSFASKVDLHQGIHQVLPVAVKPKNLPHPIHEGIIHCKQERENIRNLSISLSKAKEQTINAH